MRQIQSFKFFELGEHHEYAMTPLPEGYLVFEIFRRLRDGCELPLLYVYIYIYVRIYGCVGCCVCCCYARFGLPQVTPFNLLGINSNDFGAAWRGSFAEQ